MAVGSGELPVLHPVAGVKLGIASAGIKKPGRKDIVVMSLDAGTTVAGVFTLNQFCAAPVQVARRHILSSGLRYILVNTGNANAGTGELGLQNCLRTCEALAAEGECEASQVLPFSTGVIGEHLPVEKIVAALPGALSDLRVDGWLDAATGIMTTDTRPKAASTQLCVQGKTVTITGISKGAGMIKPNMATMLGYVATDLAIDGDTLGELIRTAVNGSFNRITIDGDTSTNDACLLMASGASGVSWSALAAGEQAQFRDALNQIFIALAQAIIRDGEGATKFVTVEVGGGRNPAECAQVAFTIAESPLVKTALFASDPNWGRLLAAIGRAGLADLDAGLISVRLNGVLIAENGCRAPSYTEEQGAAAMAEENIHIVVELGRGQARDRVWTTDLSFDYVKINAEYRT